MMIQPFSFKVTSTPLDWRQFWDALGQRAAIALSFIIPISTLLTNVLMGVIVLAWILGPNHAQKRRILWHHPIVQWVYPLILLAIIGTTYSIAESGPLRDGLSDGLRLALIPILIYFYQPKKVANWALWAFTAAMILTLFLAFLKVYGGLAIGLKYSMGAIFKSHIKTSFFMAIAAFFLVLETKRLPQYRWIFIFLSTFMTYYLLFMSAGRIGYIALVCCLFFVAWQWYRLKGILLGIVFALTLFTGAYFTSDVFYQRINILSQDLDFYHQGGRLLESSLGSRIAFAKSSIDLIKIHPLWGGGTGSFGAMYANAHAHEETLLTDNPHNEYLRMGVEFGLVGIFFLCILFIQAWRHSQQLPIEYRQLFRGFLLIFVLGCFFNSWLKDFTEGYFFIIMTAICFSALALPQHKALVEGTVH